MKTKATLLFLFFSQLAYSQIVSDNKERLEKRFSPQNNWHSVVFMEGLSIEGDNEMTWRNESESYLIDIEFEPNGATNFGVKVLLKEALNQEAIVGYSLTNEQLYINNINVGKSDETGMFTAPMKIERGRIKLQIFVSKTAVEVFGNEGESLVLAKVFPAENSTDWQIFSNGRAKIIKLSVFEQKN